MNMFRRFAMAILVVLATAGLDMSGGLDSLHQAIEDARFSFASRPPTGSTVLVEIDAPSLAAVGVWPWPRSIHAQVLDALMQAGADQVALDIDFSTRSTPAEDKALADALERSGGYAFLAAFRQYVPTTESVLVSRADPAFGANAEPALVNVERGRTGRVVGVTTGLADPIGAIPSLAARLAAHAQPPARVQPIDFSIDLARVDRVSVRELLSGEVDPGRMSGKQVVVGASAIELQDLFEVPRFGTIPGPLVQLAATETLLQDRVPIRLDNTIALWLLIVLALAAAFDRYGRLSRFVAVCAAVSLGAEIGALALYAGSAVLVETALLHVGIAGLVTFRLALQLVREYRVRRAAQERLAYLARHDPVTGALNRTGLLERIGLVSDGSGLAIFILRLMDAEAVRGTLGQAVLDDVMLQAVERLDRLQLGTVARLGDQTLAMLLAEDDEVDLALAPHIRNVMSNAFVVGQHVVHSRLSLASARRETGWSAEQLVAATEMAELTDEARDGHALFTPSIQQELERRRRLDVEMRAGISRGQFYLVYQPQVDMKDMRMAGAEALLRWDHPDFGRVSPADFIPLAEETGFIVELGAWVLHRAISDAAANPWLGRVGINVSARQFQQRDFAGTVFGVLDSCALDGRYLDLEVTEGVLSNDESVVSTLHALRRQGVGVSIDDFGTGFSSLSYLSTLPFDTLKIDRAFVRDIRPGTPNYRVTRSIVDLALSLQKSIVAEGMETAEEARVIADLGCHFGQGYWFGRPEPLAELAKRQAAMAS